MDGKIVWSQGNPVGRANAHREGDAVLFVGIAGGGGHTFAWVH